MIVRHIFGGWKCPTIEDLENDSFDIPSAVSLCKQYYSEGIGFYLVLPIDIFKSSVTTRLCKICLSSYEKRSYNENKF